MRYCDRCRGFLRTPREHLKRREALRAAYDDDLDGFRCHWSGVLLEERDRQDPFDLCFDHLFPVEASKLVVSSELLNHLKFELAPDEFPRAIHELVAHHAGRPFDRDFIEFSHWGAKAPSPTGLQDWQRAERAGPSRCTICGRARYRKSVYCSRCRGFVQLQHADNLARAKAMREAWSAEEDGFLCHYTGVKVDETDPRSPWFLSFDHRVPGDQGTIVVAAWWINAMKTSLSEEEFWKIIKELARYLDEGGEFNRDVVKFEYWRRARRHGRRY